MQRLLLIAGASVLAVSIAACRPAAPQEQTEVLSIESSSSSSLRTATVEGMLEKAGIGIIMQGTHRLQMDDGTYLMLESASVRLDDYLGQRVIVTGSLQATVEAGSMIMDVEMIEGAEPLMKSEVLLEEIPEEFSTVSVSSSAFVQEPLPDRQAGTSSNAVVSRTAKSSNAPATVTSSTPVLSSPPSPTSQKPIPPPASSSSAAALPNTSSSISAGVDSAASVRAMAKVAVDATTFTTTYCSSHIGFCIPMHKWWFYQSFGTNVSPYPWHVEVSSQSVEEVGQGIIVINLVSGGLAGTEGVAVEQGDFVVASHQWTGNRHFEVSGPRELRAAVEYMAKGIAVSE